MLTGILILEEIYFRLQVLVETLFLFILEKRLVIPRSRFIFISVPFDDSLPSIYWWVVSVDEKNGIIQGTISYGASKDLILVHTVQLKQMIKAHF